MTPPVTPQDPPGFVVATELGQAAFRNGFRLPAEPENAHRGPWLAYRSATVPGTLWLAGAGAGGPWWLATDHAGAAAALGLPAAPVGGPGLARFALAGLGELYPALSRLYDLAASLPDDPVAAFRAATAHLPRATEAERAVVVRVGQDVFRGRLLAHWGGRCPLTGITDAPLLRASHIVPWAACASDAERLDVENGLLLSALWDAAFDRGLVTFDDDGRPCLSPRLGPAAVAALRADAPLPLTPGRRDRLAWHRANVFAA